MKRFVLRRFYEMTSSRTAELPVYHPDKEDPSRTGIECPHCGEELITRFTILPFTYPERLLVGCLKCRFRGGILRYAQ